MRYPYAYNKGVCKEGKIVAVNPLTLIVLDSSSEVKTINLDDWILQERGKDTELAWSKKLIWIYEDDNLDNPPVKGYRFLGRNWDSNLFIKEE